MAWGANPYGELGNGTTSNSSVPVPVSNLSGVTSIAAGNYFGLAIKSDGTVWDWGSNDAGQLGNGTTTNSSVPVQAEGLTHVIQVAGGGEPKYAGQSVALESNGTVWTWGYNFQGQLGLGNTTAVDVPTEVPHFTGVTAIAAGGADTYALQSSGTVWAWGSGAQGELGTGGGHSSSTPVQIQGLPSDIVAIGAGYEQAFAVASNGTVWAWGTDTDGQLGDGGACGKSCTTPVQVETLSSPAQVTGGYAHSLAAASNGTVWAWGDNAYGQLGNGTTTNESTPIQTGTVHNVSTSVTTQTGYTYDGTGLLASRTTAAGTQSFTWDEALGTPLILSDGTNSYIYGPGGVPIEQISSGGQVDYLAQDALGSTRLITDSSGTVVGTTSYSPYGQVTAQSGTVTTPFGYAGQYTDATTGLVYMRARWCDPGTGQFLSQDPLVLLTQQPYAYVSDNPLSATDASGLARGLIEGGGDGLSVSESAINAAPPDAASGFGQTVTSDTNPGETSGPSCSLGTTNSASRSPSQLLRGQVSEQTMLNELGLTKNTSAIEGGSSPDSLDGGVISELKDQQYVYKSSQFRNYVQDGRPINLYLFNPDASVSLPLERAIIRSGGLIYVRLGPGTYSAYLP